MLEFTLSFKTSANLPTNKISKIIIPLKSTAYLSSKNFLKFVKKKKSDNTS